jgi:hypothetical protein
MFSPECVASVLEADNKAVVREERPKSLERESIFRCGLVLRLQAGAKAAISFRGIVEWRGIRYVGIRSIASYYPRRDDGAIVKKHSIDLVAGFSRLSPD